MFYQWKSYDCNEEKTVRRVTLRASHDSSSIAFTMSRNNCFPNHSTNHSTETVCDLNNVTFYQSVLRNQASKSDKE